MSLDPAAAQLLQSLGPHASPTPASLDVANLNGSDGSKWVLLVLSTPTGRTGVWLSVDDATKWAALLAKVADAAAKAPSPLLVTPTIPDSLPMPGTTPPNVRLN